MYLKYTICAWRDLDRVPKNLQLSIFGHTTYPDLTRNVYFCGQKHQPQL